MSRRHDPRQLTLDGFLSAVSSQSAPQITTKTEVRVNDEVKQPTRSDMGRAAYWAGIPQPLKDVGGSAELPIEASPVCGPSLDWAAWAARPATIDNRIDDLVMQIKRDLAVIAEGLMADTDFYAGRIATNRSTVLALMKVS